MDAIKQNYINADNELRIRRSIIGCILSAILVPAGTSLDYFVYHDFLGTFFIARMLCSLGAVLILFIHYSNFGRKHVRILMFSWMILVQITICSMILVTEQHVSTYYAGLNLTIMGVAILLPISAREITAFSIVTIFLYVFSSIYGVAKIDYGVFINNLYFIILTGIISITASYFNSKNRFKEFCLNYELGETNEKLSKMDKLKTQFFANVSHEFRTPLTLILGPVQDVLHDPFNKLPPKINNIFNLVQQNGLRLLKLVNDLLDVIRLEEGKSDLKLKKIEVNSLVAGVTDSMMHLADMQQIELNKEIEDKESFIKGDPSAIDKIIINLLNNAIKFTPKEGQVVLSTRSTDSKFILTIKDTGIGIGEKDLSRIFDRFAQADSSSTREYQGTGIGLALVKELIELQNGKVSVASKVGQGATFTIEFPLYDEQAENLRIEEEKKSKIESEKDCLEIEELKIQAQEVEDEEDKLADLHKMAHKVGGLVTQHQEEDFELDDAGDQNVEGKPTIIVVDDEVDMRNYIVGLLREQDYNVLYAKDGESGLRMIQELKPDLAVLDLMLPKIDGLTICKQLKDDEKTKLIKVILLTARVDEDAKLTALRNGADDFVTKPFNALEVKGRVKNLLEARRLQSEVQDKNEELREALQELRTTQGQLVQSEKINALGNLAAGLLHEVNNPLNYTMTALQMIKMDPHIEQDADLKDTVADIEEGMGRIKTIISDLRAFAYPEESSKQVEFSIYEAVSNAARFTAHDCKDVEVVNEVSKDLIVKGSQTHIVQILINLISNGVKAIGKTDRKGLIIITSKEEKGRVVIHVKDNGCGMNEKTVSKVFDPFFTTGDVGEGMGLGLSVCHTIMKSHGGSLAVTSEESEGSEFCFDLPSS